MTEENTMEIIVSQEQGRVSVTVFRVKGEINAATYEQLQKRAEEVVAAGTRDLLIDLTEVPYMSSAGLRALNHIFNLLDRDANMSEAVRKGVANGTYKSPHLKLLNPTPRVLEALRMAGFDMFLEIHHSHADALASF
jgi:anti-anti-sigma factor